MKLILIIAAVIVALVFVGCLSTDSNASSGYWHGTEGDDYHKGHQAANGHGGNDVLIGHDSKDFIYGGEGDDEIRGLATGAGNSDDLFGGDFSCESDKYGFPGWPEEQLSCEEYPPGIDGSDHIYGGKGKDFIWESNSDNVGDNHVDYVYGQGGYDICTVEVEDVVKGCEEIHYVT